MIKIVNNQNREVLNEGRNFGIGFAFLKRTGEESFETVQPISPCKDYLNDVVYSEMTGRDCRAYGLKYSKKNIYEDFGYMAIRVCHFNDRGNTYQKFDFELKALTEGKTGLKYLLNWFERTLEMKGRTHIRKVEDNLYMFRIPLTWCSTTYMISLYSLLIRVGRWYTKDKNVMDYLENFKDFESDIYLLRSAMPNIKRVLEAKNVEQTFPLSGNESVHNAGICSY